MTDPPNLLGKGLWQGGMDGFLKKNLDTCRNVITKDWDMVIAIDGYEGSGKSVLAQQCAKYVDPSFCIDRICFNPKEFVDSINSAKKFEAVIYDEAYGGMSSRAAMTEVNRTLMSVLAEIRQKNLWVFLVLPSFFEMDKYAAVHRSRFLLHVYTGEGFKRGFFAFFNADKKKLLYIIGKKFYSYSKPRANFVGRFPKGYVVTDEAYRTKKHAALEAYSKTKEKPESRRMKNLKDRLYQAVLYMKREGLSYPSIAKTLGTTDKTIKQFVYDYEKRGGSDGPAS